MLGEVLKSGVLGYFMFRLLQKKLSRQDSRAETCTIFFNSAPPYVVSPSLNIPPSGSELV
jgi:hypothetical protein